MTTEDSFLKFVVAAWDMYLSRAETDTLKRKDLVNAIRGFKDIPGLSQLIWRHIMETHPLLAQTIGLDLLIDGI